MRVYNSDTKHHMVVLKISYHLLYHAILQFVTIHILRSIKAWDLNFSLISLYQLITANYMIVNIINA